MKRIFKTRLLIIGLIANAIALLPQVSSGLTIEEVVALALENNPGLQKQQMNQALSEEDLRGIKSQNFGKIDVVASYGHYNLPRTLVPLTPASIFNDPTAVPTTQDLFTTGIMYEVPLFTGFAQQRSVEIAVLEKEMAGTAIKLSREQLIYNVKTLYVNILSFEAQEEAQQEYHTALQRLYNDISLEVKLGKKARVEQLKAAADQENARVKVRQISGNIKIMKASLAALLNRETINTLEEYSIEIPVSGGTEYNNKDIQELDRYHSAVLDVEKKTRLVEKSSATYYPQVVFNGFYGQNYGPNDSSNLNEGDWNNDEIWQAVVNVKWTVFDFGSRKASKQMAAIRKQQSRRDRLTTELELKRSLREAVTKIEMALDDFHSAETELALTRETENIEQTRFEKGAADLNDLLYAKARNQLALSRSITARYSYQNSRFYLDYLLENGENK
jgi:outer membrane protein TolC